MRLSAGVALAFLAGAGASAQSICEVQGAGEASAFVGRNVTLSGVVTFDASDAAGPAFVVQDPVCDADPATSDAILVRGPGAATVGHRVVVTGVVTEEAGATTLMLQVVRDEGRFSGSLELVTLDLPADPDAARTYLEAREWMLGTLRESLVIGATDGSGEAFVVPADAGIGRLYRDDTDGRRLGVAASGGWLGMAHGDRVTSAVGVVTPVGERHALRLTPGGAAQVAPSGAAPSAAGADPGQLSIASYAFDRLYDASDDPSRDDQVPDPESYARALARAAHSISTLLAAPDLVGVQEVESEAVLADLAATPEAAAAGYQALSLDGPAADGLDVGLLYRPERVVVLAAESRQGCTPLGSGLGECPTSGGSLLYARPPLVARLQTLDGERLAAVVVDFTGPAGSVDPALRLAMAEHVAAIANAERAAGSAVVVLGSLDDTAQSSTLEALLGSGGLVQLQPAGDYTHVPAGLSEQVDFVLVDAGLAGRATSVGAVHVNVDFPTPAPGSPDGHRASDHDPVLLRLSR